MVRTEQQGPVFIVTLDRPEARNAVDRPTADALVEAFRGFEQESSALVAVLWGAGGSFCAGADLKALASGQTERINRLTPGGDGPMGPTRMQLSKPVIAAVAGHAVAGGLELACWCDLRVIEEDSVLGVFCRRWGVPLIDGGTVRLPRLIGLSRAMDLILTGRPVHAEEALQIGLANRVVPKGEALTASVALALQIASSPQSCMRADRLSALASLDRPELEAMAEEFQRGTAVLAEALPGALRFAEGAGRHGAR